MSYYHGLISSRRANSLLTSKPDGSFLLRDSQSQPGNFVLSAKSGGRMYHVLVFNQGGKYHLDSAGEQSDDPVLFKSLDDLVAFCGGHELRVEGDDVLLHDAVACADSPSTALRISSNVSRAKDDDDNDYLTDLFANIFGTQCNVICIAHSKVRYTSKLKDGERLYLAAIVKDRKSKGWFIRVVDSEEKRVVGEKKLSKIFEYDMPSDLLMTFLSEDGIACIGFRDACERDCFLHQVDRIVKLQQDRAVKLRGRLDTEPTPVEQPDQITHQIKASDFNIDHLTAEWKYLFEQAGVTRAMLEDTTTLQFILDTLYHMGGAPKKLDEVEQEALVTAELACKSSPKQERATVERRKERAQALAIDYNLKRETLRASRLSQQLEKQSLSQKKKNSLTPRAHICSYLALCERYKDHLMIKHSFFTIGPENASCFCDKCAAGKPLVQVSGSPPQQFSLPLGWSQFVHKAQSHALSQKFSARWHVAFCSVPSSRVAGVMRTGQLQHSHSTGEVQLSPDIGCACKIASFTPERYYDEVTGQTFRAHTVFKLHIQPDTYSVCVSDDQLEMESGSSLQTQLVWCATERTYLVHSLLVKMLPMD